MRTRYFTPEEANAVLPQVKGYLVRMRAAARELRELSAVLEPEAETTAVLAEEYLKQGLEELEALRHRIRTWIEEVGQLGAEVKDIESGLLDFPALKGGQEVCLCWKFGEAEIAYWHGVHDGFHGRKPIADAAPGDWVWFS